MIAIVAPPCHHFNRSPPVSNVTAMNNSLNEYATTEHALKYLALADKIPHRVEGESVLLEFIPRDARRILDLGSGDGRLLALLRIDWPQAEAVALDFSPTMLETARARFKNDPGISIVDHNLDHPLPALGQFDAVVSSFAIHHCADERKKSLYAEIFEILTPGGVFMNLEHVSAGSPELHARFLRALNITPADEDPSNKCLPIQIQLDWLREIGFEDVDCHWKWLELALLGGVKPPAQLK
jgi:SAM-dependent methyltransferase